LGDYVWKTYQLEENKPSELNSANSSTAPSQDSLPDSGDLQWLRENLPVLDVNLSDLIQDGLNTLIGICDSSGVQVEYHCQEPTPVLFLQPSLFRQGLLNLLITIIQFVPGGEIRIQAYKQTEKIVIDIEAIPSIDRRGQNSQGIMEGLNTAGLFFNCCNGSIEIEDPTDTTPLRVRIALPILERMAVLVVEDHADTLHLFQRYLADSRYIFWGASSVNEGLVLAEAILPRVIVLDVMMPESDGWEFLGRLHVHPKLMHIPVIVYSIVSQENLALSLGAAEFLQKPISRKELLAALDRQVTRSSRESG
jgi:CheY-like chemotaxis protein